ncbi:MAG: DUF1311 domain-containing protein [Verrucomicrobiaceae bacterium]|nr:MAG: DUF1311 domain-containing protein [Verrucomicrobiaceae bacterium]
MKLPSMLFLLAFAPLTVHAQSNAEMKEEAGSILDKSDQAMNKAYQQLLSILNDEGKKRLRETQRAWLAYRDAQAGFDSHHMAGGTGEGLERLGSLNMLTGERTKRLQEDYKRFKEFQ